MSVRYLAVASGNTGKWLFSSEHGKSVFFKIIILHMGPVQEEEEEEDEEASIGEAVEPVTGTEREGRGGGNNASIT